MCKSTSNLCVCVCIQTLSYCNIHCFSKAYILRLTTSTQIHALFPLATVWCGILFEMLLRMKVKKYYTVNQQTEICTTHM